MPRTILVHLNVEAPDDDPRDADAISEAVLGVIQDSDLGLDISVAMSEEI